MNAFDDSNTTQNFNSPDDNNYYFCFSEGTLAVVSVRLALLALFIGQIVYAPHIMLCDTLERVTKKSYIKKYFI